MYAYIFVSPKPILNQANNLILSSVLSIQNWKEKFLKGKRTYIVLVYYYQGAQTSCYIGQRREWRVDLSVIINAVVVVTGYGNLHPTSCTGRILVLVYSLIGIPLNGIVLTQLGSFFESRVSK